ncbi:MAG: MlaD family protein [Holosporales bacterium]
METRANYTAVGAFVVALITGFVLFLLWMSKVNFSESAHYYDIYFEGAVTGLRENEDVRYHGIAIGTVEEISIDPNRIDRARVRISIEQPELIREGLYASLEARGLTGFSYIQLNGGGAKNPPIVVKPGEVYPVIPSRSSGLQRVVAEAPMILERLYELLGHMNEMLDAPTRHNFRATVHNLAIVSGRLAEGEGALHTTLISVKGAMDKLGSLADGAGGVLQNVEEQANEVGHFLRTNQTLWQTNLRQMAMTLHEVGQAANTLSRVLMQVEQGPGALWGQGTEKGVAVQ